MGLADAESHCLASGMDDYLEKPVAVELLQTKIMQFLIQSPPKRVISTLQEMCLGVVGREVGKGLESLEGLKKKEFIRGQGDLVAQKVLDYVAKEKRVITPKIIDMFSIFRITRFKLIPFVPGKGGRREGEVKKGKWWLLLLVLFLFLF